MTPKDVSVANVPRTFFARLAFLRKESYEVIRFTEELYTKIQILQDEQGLSQV